MPMDQKHRDYLKNCNCLIKMGQYEGAAVRKDGVFFAPNGLKIVVKEWRPANHDEIVKYMDDNNIIPIVSMKGLI